MTRVKCCGITREPDLAAAVDAGADAVGLTCEVSVDSPREVPVERAAALAEATPPFVATVLVTMADADRVGALVDRIGPDAVQLHGAGAGDAAAVAADCDAAVLVATDPAGARDLPAAVDGIVVDSLDDAGAGGTGETHDWAAARSVVADLAVPVVLAGGLTPANVGEAVRAVDPYAVDVASGVEAAGGRKDHDAVRAFVDAARTAGSRPVGEPES